MADNDSITLEDMLTAFGNMSAADQARFIGRARLADSEDHVAMPKQRTRTSAPEADRALVYASLAQFQALCRIETVINRLVKGAPDLDDEAEMLLESAQTAASVAEYARGWLCGQLLGEPDPDVDDTPIRVAYEAFRKLYLAMDWKIDAAEVCAMVEGDDEGRDAA